jgi:hypothetical protein
MKLNLQEHIRTYKFLVPFLKGAYFRTILDI